VPDPGVTVTVAAPVLVRLPGLIVHDPLVLFETEIVEVVGEETETNAESEALPLALEQVFVYVVLTEGLTFTDPFTAVEPLHQSELHDVAPLVDQVTTEVPPEVIDEGDAETDTEGTGAEQEPPLEFIST
jgi:hypothetical protein